MMNWTADFPILAADENGNRCLLYTSDAADEEDSVDLGERGMLKKKKKKSTTKKKHNK